MGSAAESATYFLRRLIEEAIPGDTYAKRTAHRESPAY